MRHRLVFGETYAIKLLIDSFFCVSKICSDSFRTFSVWNVKIVFFRILYSWLSFCLQWNSSSVSLDIFPSSGTLVLKHHSALQLSWLLNMCTRGTWIASLNSSIIFYLLFFIMYSKSFLSWIASALVYPHHWSLIYLTMEKMCLATTFTRWEGSARKYGSWISSSSFPLDDFRNRPRAPLDGCLNTARIVL